MTYEITWKAGASRDVDQLPLSIASAVVEFIDGPLVQNPHRVGNLFAFTSRASTALAELLSEQDDSRVSGNNQHLIEFSRVDGCRGVRRYGRRSAPTDLARAIPNAIA